MSETKQLKSKTILTRKPLLKLMPNHLDTGVSKHTRHWPSQIRGLAMEKGGIRRNRIKKENLMALNNTQQMIGKECDDIKALLLQKNEEYGDSAVNPIRIFSSADSVEQIKVRIDDKLSRLSNKGPKSIVEDTTSDLIGYLILLRVAEKLKGKEG